MTYLLPQTRNTRLYLAILLFMMVIAASYSPYSHAAYCSLRDPITAINKLYPSATHHRSITREINRDNRHHISQSLPFTLLFNELGKHTLYAIMEDKVPLGFIHARSELTNSGLIEVVWAINLDMTIKDSYFQRCRNPKSKDPIFIADMKKLVKSRSFDQLLNEVNSKQHSDLLSAIIKSALKTIAVTELVWRDDIEELRRNKLIYSYFGSDKEIAIEKDIKTKNTPQGMTFSMLTKENIDTYKIMKSKKDMGTLVHAHWEQYNYSGSFYWLFSPDGVVLDITPDSQWPNAEIATVFDNTIGKDVSNIQNCNTATELAGAKLFHISQ